MEPFSSEDRDLISAAQEIIKLRLHPRWHGIGAALRTVSGNVFSAVNVDGVISNAGVCGERAAIAIAAASGDTEIDLIVAVDWEGRVVSPCGLCREIIAEYSPGARVIVPDGRGESILTIEQLLPNRFVEPE